MIDDAKVDVERTAVLWLKDGTFLEIPESQWASEDQNRVNTEVAYSFVKKTGLKVSIKTTTNVTARPETKGFKWHEYR